IIQEVIRQMDRPFVDFEDEIVKSLQDLVGSSFDTLIGLITVFGSTLSIVVLVAIIFWCVDKRLALILAFTTAISEFTNDLLKGIFGFVRPYQHNSEIRPVKDFIGELPEDYSFPSGHSQSTGAFCSSAYLMTRNRIIGLFGMIMIVIVPLTRILLGVHYLSDVIVGAFLGVCFGLGVNYYLPKIESILSNIETQKDSEQHLLRLSCLIVAITIIGYCIAVTIIALAGNDIILADVATIAGIIAGLSVGAMLEHNYVKLPIDSSNKQLFLFRAIIGLILVLILYFGLTGVVGLIVTEEEFPIYPIAQYIRYFLMSVLAVAGISFIFAKIEPKLGLRDIQ
ncbi:MAG: phosphatase PAP2 family protein, partial [Promethearchaeota archaeon]